MQEVRGYRVEKLMMMIMIQRMMISPGCKKAMIAESSNREQCSELVLEER